jgi:hypothetical protein
LIITPIFRKPLIHLRAAFIWIIIQIIQVVQIIQLLWTILYPWQALLIVPHDHVEETGLWQIMLYICQNHLMRHRGLLLGNHLHRGFFFDDLLRHDSRRRSRGCDGVPFNVIMLILIIVVLSYAIESILFSSFSF